MFVVKADFTTLPNKQKEFHQTLQLILSLCLKVSGCLNAQYAIGPEDENTFHLVMEWNGPAYWENYKQTDEFKALMGMKTLLTTRFHMVAKKSKS